MAQIPPSRYAVLKGAVGKRFLTIATHKLAQVRAREWNSERPLVFVAVVLQKNRRCVRARTLDIRQRLL